MTVDGIRYYLGDICYSQEEELAASKVRSMHDSPKKMKLMSKFNIQFCKPFPLVQGIRLAHETLTQCIGLVHTD